MSSKKKNKANTSKKSEKTVQSAQDALVKDEKAPEPSKPPKPVLSKSELASIRRQNEYRLSTLTAADISGAVDVLPEKGRFFKEVLRRFLMLICAVVMIAAVIKIVMTVQSRKGADEYYDALRKMFYESDVTSDNNIGYLAEGSVMLPDDRLYSDEGDIYESEAIEVLDMQAKFQKMLPNLEALASINSSAFGWIKVEGTRIDYPVVKAPYENNDYYLSHALDHTYSVSGSIFMDWQNDTNLKKNKNTCICGHNMNDGTMFQTIMNFRNGNQFRNGRIEIYTKNGIFVYRPFAAYTADPAESFFHTEITDEEYPDFLQEIREKSMFASPVTVRPSDTIVTLYTCTNTLIDNRFVVHGVLTDVIR